MSWAVGICQESRPQKFLMLSDEKELTHIDVTSLGKHGVPTPKATKRIVYTGNFSSWVRDSTDRYLKNFDIELPAAVTNRHAVFCFSLEDGTRVHVPALVLIRGLFKPSNWMPPAVFTPGNVDTLGFVDYSCDPPKVVLDLDQNTSQRDAGSCAQLLSWIHTSHSARRSAQSVYQYSLDGSIDLALPLGEFRLVLHGTSVGSNIFVTKMCPISTTVRCEDSVAQTERSFFFQQMAAASRKVTPLTELPAIAACRRLGRSIWKRWIGYHRRCLVETKMNCIKRLGERVMSRTFERQVNELHIRAAILNRFTELGRPQTAAVA